MRIHIARAGASNADGLPLGGLRRLLAAAWIAIIAILLGAGPSAAADIKFGSGSLVSTSVLSSSPWNSTTHTNALCTYNSQLCVTGQYTLRAPQIQELYQTLRRGGAVSADDYITNVFEYVRRNIKTEYRFGLSKGALGALQDQSGTPFDQAQLMVTLLKMKSGVTTGYLIGTVKISATDFTAWTGVTKATAACNLLASGGFPAIVKYGSTAMSSCSDAGAVGQNVSEVTIGHIWVVAKGSGNSLLYDPSIKTHQVLASQVASLINCDGGGTTCADKAKAQALPSGTTGTDSGAGNAAFVESVHTGDLATQLNGYATSIQQGIQAAAVTNAQPIARVEAVAGGRRVDLTAALPAGAASLTNYTVIYGTVASPLADIPDAYRTKLRVQAGGVDATLYADETVGNWLYLGGYKSSPSFPTTRTVNLLLEREAGVSAPNTTNVTNGAQKATNEVVPITTASASASSDMLNVTLTVTHPYTDTSENESLSMDAVFSPDDGSTHTQLIAPLYIMQFWGAAGRGQLAKQSLITADKSQCLARVLTGTGLGNPSGAQTPLIGVSIPAYAASWATQSTAAVTLSDGVNNAITQHHHLIGLVGQYTSNMSPIGRYQLSVVRVAGDSSLPAQRTDAALIGALEGGVLEQSQSLINGGDAVSWFNLINNRGVRLYDVNSGNVSSVLSASSNYSSSEQTVVTHLAQSGSLIIPKDGDLGDVGIASSGIPVITYFVSPLFRYTSSATDLNFGITANEIGGGAVSVAPSALGFLDTVQKQDRSLKVAPQVELASGALTITPPADLVTGVGDFPNTLALQRFYDSQAVQGMTIYIGCQGFPGLPCGYLTSYDQLRQGWSHNFEIRAEFGSDGMQGMGAANAVDASQALAAIYVLGELHQTSGFQQQVMSLFVSDWLMKQFLNNVVHVTQPPAVHSFTLLPDGTFDPAPGDYGKLQPSSMPTPKGVAFDYSAINLTLTERDGAQLKFSNKLDLTGGHVYGSGPIDLKPDDWIFPSGVTVHFTYVSQGSQSTGIKLLSQVKNSLGRYLNFTQTLYTPGSNPSVTDADGYTDEYLVVADDASRTVRFRAKPAPLGFNGISSAGDKVMNADGTKWLIAYDVPGDSDNRAPSVRLSQIFSPLSTSTPVLGMSYDSLRRAVTYQDGDQNETDYYPAKISNERYAAGFIHDDEGGVTKVYFDQGNQAVQTINPLQKVTLQAYDDAERLVLTTYPELNSEERTYDVRSNPLTIVRHPKSGATLITTNWHYPSTDNNLFLCPDADYLLCNQPVDFTDGNRSTTTFSYFSWGGLKQILRPADKNALQPQTDLVYVTKTSVLDSTKTFYLLQDKKEKLDSTRTVWTRFDYQSSAQKFVPSTSTINRSQDVSGGLNAITQYTFDAVGNLTNVNGPRDDAGDAADVKDYVWDVNNRRLLTTVDGDHNDSANPTRRAATNFQYDANGRLTYVEKGYAVSPDGTTFTFTALQRQKTDYDLAGNKTRDTVYDLTQSPVTVLAVSQFSYDRTNRPECVAERMKLSPATNPSLPTDDQACTLQTVTAGQDYDRITKFTYDDAGQKLAEIRALGVSGRSNGGNEITYATYTYTDNGNVQALEDAEGNLTSYSYDVYDRLKTVQFPSPNTKHQSNAGDKEVYGYDKNDNRTSVTKRNGQLYTYVFDDLDQRINLTPPSSGLTSPAVAYDYDLMGHMTSAKFGDGTGVTFGYDAAGRQTSETTFGKTVGFGLDKAGNRILVTWPDSVSFGYKYDADGLMTKICDGSCATQPVLLTVAYDNLHQRTEIDRTGSAATTGPIAYDGMGRLISLKHDLVNANHDVTLSFTFNPASQIVTRAVNSSDSYTYVPHTPVPASQYDGLNRPAAVAANSGFDADQNQQKSDDGTRTFSYDGEDRLTGVAEGSSSLALSYDPLGRLYQTNNGGGATTFLYEGSRLVAEYSGSTLQHRYVHGPGGDEPMIWYSWNGSTFVRNWLHADAQGSIIAVSNDNGQLVSQYRYGPYGEPDSWSGSRFRYTGQIMLTEARLYHYKARAYDPQTGRFLQTDPIGNDDDLDPYAYVREDPLNQADPSGEACKPSEPISKCDPSQLPAPVTPPSPPPSAPTVTVTVEEVTVSGKLKMWSPLATGARYLGERDFSFPVPVPVIHFNQGSQQNPPRKVNPTKQTSPVWKKLQNWRNGMKQDKNHYYDWDPLHNDIEVYNKRGQHEGSMDPNTGAMYKPAVAGRKINV